MFFLSITLFIFIGKFDYKGASDSFLALGGIFFTSGVIYKNGIFDGVSYSVLRMYKRESYFDFCEKRKLRKKKTASYLMVIGGTWIILSIVFAIMYLR